MDKKSNFFVCKRCKNLVSMITSSGVPLYCCGNEMTNMEPIYTEEGAKKHQPVVKRDGDVIKVDVGSVEHPMAEDHAISWIALVTNRGLYRKFLIPNAAPKVAFHITDELPICVYSYCNLHGLWKTQLLQESAERI